MSTASSALATTRNGSQLATPESQDFLTQEKIDLIKRTVFPNATDLELEMFLNLANTKHLDPLTNQIYAIKYGSEKASMFASIDGLRIIAQRSGEYGGQTAPYWCGPDLVWREVWLDDAPPAAAKVGVWKRGYEHPTWGVATWKSYAFDRKGNQKGNNWRSMPDVMLAKCLPYKAIIETDQGSLAIGKIVRDRMPVRVRTIDFNTNEETWAPVVNWWRNGSTRQWVRLWTPNGTRGNRPVRLTNDHPVMTKDGWCPAGAIGLGGKVAVASPVLSTHQRQVIIGGLLGDGMLAGRKRASTLPSYVEAHSVKQREYVEWKASALSNLRPLIQETSNGDGTGKKHATVRLRTMAAPALYEFRQMTPERWLDEAGPLALAVWLMDDGSIKRTGKGIGRPYIRLYCCGFGEAFAHAAAKKFRAEYNLHPVVARPTHNPYLQFGVDDTERLLLRLQEYIGFDAETNTKVWRSPSVMVGPKSGTALVPIIRVEHSVSEDAEGRYDIEVEGTHNFLYNNVVVSNCAESIALRKAFPDDLSGLYVREEFSEQPEAGGAHQARAIAPAGPGEISVEDAIRRGRGPELEVGRVFVGVPSSAGSEPIDAATGEITPEEPLDVIAAEIKALRERLGWTAADASAEGDKKNFNLRTRAGLVSLRTWLEHLVNKAETEEDAPADMGLILDAQVVGEPGDDAHTR